MKQVGLNNNTANLLIFWIESVDLDLHACLRRGSGGQADRLCGLFVRTNAEARFGRKQCCHLTARQRLAID